MALAIFGSEINTSLMSRGRSITTDLPIPSRTKREVASLPTTWITASCGLAAAALSALATQSAAITGTSDAMPISVLQVMSHSPLGKAWLMKRIQTRLIVREVGCFWRQGAKNYRIVNARWIEVLGPLSDLTCFRESKNLPEMGRRGDPQNAS